ncbi:MAG TPA: hypothetical protein DCR40_05360 [Prolixibacteraceae bacterium]|nr:hypothetical protein [Prolixibacteraceae bacterium]
MKNSIKKNSFFILTLVIMVTVFLNSCDQMSESIIDKSIGTNGSFEHAKNGLPVNWFLYTPKTVQTGSFDIITDTTEFKDGKQSLKFLVRECSAMGGRLSPGFFQEFHETKPGETYKVSFWIKNRGSEFIVKIYGVSDMKGEDGHVLKSKETFDTWRLFEYLYTIPPKVWIRFEMNILQPGSFWIDDIKIERVKNN